MIHSPFKFLDPFGPQDNKVFFGRKAEIDELYALVFRTPLLLVYGLTGTGKTSLIDCGLRNRFDGTDWLPFYVRRKENINEALREILHKAQPDDKDRDLPETVAYLYRYFLRPVYLIFDQFEELFILGTKAEQKEFKKNLKTLLDANLTCKVILIMREEYIGWLYDFEREIPAIFDFRLRVETMKRKNIKEVIEKSCAAFNVGLEDPKKNIEQIYDNVSEGKAVVQLPYLQVYLDTLYRSDVQRTYPQGAPKSDEQSFPPLTFTGQEITDCGLISSVLESFLQEKVGELQQNMAQKHPGLPPDAVKTVLNSFVTTLGTKKPMPYQLVNKQVQLLFPPEVLRDFQPAFIHNTLMALEQNRILRNSGETFELAHDTLAQKIHENRSEEDKRREEVQARLHIAFKEYQDSGTYLNAPQIARLEEWLPILRLSGAEADFVKASRVDVEAKRNKEHQLRLRAQTFSYIASVVAVLAIGLGFFAFQQQRKVNSLFTIVDAQKRRAEAVLDKIYFYEDKFGLAYEDSTRKYGYIDKDLNTKIDFKYDEAFSFEDIGFARVKRKVKDNNYYEVDTYFLIDTLGKEYKLATELNQLDSTITALDLREKKLKAIPPEVFRHQQLAVLILQGNQISNLPNSIGMLNNLMALNLSGNELMTLPAEIWQLTHLQNLDLSSNQLKSLPTEFGKLTQLKSLYLSSNPLTTLPAEIGKLTQLQSLNLRFNQLTTLPTEFGKLTQLKSLYLNGNQLKSLPTEFGKLTQLKSLYLNGNQLKSLPTEFGKLIQLQELGLSGNQLKTLPEEFGKLIQLKELGLSRNQLKTLPEEFGKLTQLQSLNLHFNQLDTLPAEIGKLTQLQDLDLSSNQLDTLPKEIGKLTKLQSLSLSINKLTTLPTEIGKLTKLQSLSLSSNKLTNLPAEIGKLTKLQDLVLMKNKLKTLPAEIGKLTQLQYMYLMENKLTNLPAEIGKLTQVQFLNLDGNQLTNLPAEIGKLTQVQFLNLDGNQLKTLPDLSNLTKLKGMSLMDNPIPKPVITSLRAKMPWCKIEFDE